MVGKSQNGWLRTGYWGFAAGANFIGHLFLLIVRLYWGAQFIMTGLGKYMNIQQVASFFGSLDIPYPLFTAYIVGAFEIFGGFFLMIGLFSRLSALFLSAILIVALMTAHHEAALQIFTNPSIVTKEAPFLFLYTTLAVFCFGSGLFSIDYWLEKKAFGEAL